MRCCSGQATTAAAVYFLTGRGVACRTEAAGSDGGCGGTRCGRAPLWKDGRARISGQLHSLGFRAGFRNEKARAALLVASSAFHYVDLNVELAISELFSLHSVSARRCT